MVLTCELQAYGNLYITTLKIYFSLVAASGDPPSSTAYESFHVHVEDGYSDPAIRD